ncbi:hypothetical protein NVV78_08130 [Pediococcus ethanolidurans]|nr:hypothetical protein [Pediococcus ethanolidurans]MCV3315907.1 hypothetical protein [Pediococcus ethanolidurans]
MGFWVMLFAFIIMLGCGYYAFKERRNNRLMAIGFGIISILALAIFVYLV